MVTNLRRASIVLIVALWAAPSAAVAQGADSQVDHILKALDSGLDNLTAALADRSIRWPELRSVSSLSAKPVDRAAPWQDRIASAFFGRLRAFEDEDSLDLSLDRRRWMIYVNLVKAFREGGGFFNYILADTVQRIALSRLGYRVANAPADCREADQYLAQLGVMRWSPDDINRFAKDSLGQDVGGAQLTSGEPISFARAFESLGAKSEEIGSYATSMNLATSELRMPVASTVRLAAVRILETQMLATSVLPGYCVFVNAGGEPERVTHKDISHFTAVMGPRRAQFGFEPFGFVALRASDVINFVQQFRNPDKVRAYRRIALQ